jgi:hypothetical protein
MNTIRVRAKGDAMLPVLGMRGRYVDVPAESYYLRAVARGDIEAVKAVSEVSE